MVLAHVNVRLWLALRLRRAGRFARLVAVLTLVGCTTTPFERTNPYDPSTPLMLHLLSLRDSVFQIGDEALFQLVTEPAFVLGSQTWSNDRPDLLASLGEGRFRVVALPPVNTTVAVIVYLGLRADTASIVVVAP
jgi:hypothetical protein